MTDVNKNIKNTKSTKMARALATFAVGMSSISANSCCIFIYHQPKVPKGLKKLRKF